MKLLLITSKIFCAVFLFNGLANSAEVNLQGSEAAISISNGNVNSLGYQYNPINFASKPLPRQENNLNSAEPLANQQFPNLNQFENSLQIQKTGNNVDRNPNFYGVSQIEIKLPKLNLPEKAIDLSSLDDFINKFRKSYSSRSEKTYRQYIYKQNQQRVNRHNQDSSRSFNMGLNKFADLTADQFRKIYTNALPYNGNRPRTGIKKNIIVNDPPNPSPKNRGLGNGIDLSANSGPPGLVKKSSQDSINYGRFLQSFNIDWKAVSGPIQNQGFCGCCYSFTPNDNIAALQKIRNPSKEFQFLSTQEIIDCSTWDTYGCNGGYIDAVFDYIIFNGISYQSEYKFTSGRTGRQGGCIKKSSNFKIKNYFGIQPGSCSAVIEKLKQGPVSVGIAGYELQLYEKGIFPKCQYKYVDHAVLLIGYKSSEYWTIKNGWGTDWGEEGYARIAPGNTCQICQDAWYPELV